MRILYFVVAIFLITSNASATTNLHFTIQNTPVLLIIEPRGAGSGIYVRTDTGVYLVTAKHVLYDEKGALKGSKARLVSYDGNEIKKQIIFDVDLKITQENQSIFFHNSKDLAAIRVVRFAKDSKTNEVTAYLSLGVTQKREADATVTIATIEDTKPYKSIRPSTDVFVLGYPTSLSLDIEGILDPTTPLLRKGIVAGKNDKNHTIIIDCPVFQGNSGGPVFEQEADKEGILHTKLIGIVSKFVPLVEKWRSSLYDYENLNLSNSGYAVVVPLDDIQQFIKDK